MLHFSFYNTGISRDQYQKLIEKEMNKASGRKDYKYQENAENMYALLQKYGDQGFAIQNAAKLEKQFFDRSYADHNPCTKVHILVKKLLALVEDYKV